MSNEWGETPSTGGYSWDVIAPPAGTSAWTCWEDGSLEGPFPVLAMAFEKRSAMGALETKEINLQRADGKPYRYIYYRTPESVDEFARGDEPFEWATCWVYLAVDWEEPRWLRHGDNAHFTKEGAENRATWFKATAERMTAAAEQRKEAR